MAGVIKIDGFDFFQYLRVAPGEGFDPASPGFADPQFGDTVSSDAQPLISVNERNKEMVWPLHLNAASKDALHALLIDTNRRLSNARQVEWRDQGATNSTFFDVVFARFDPDYNYRRGERNWLSGMLRVWVKPYGLTGTYRAIGSTPTGALGIPQYIDISAGSLAGDTPALINASTHHYYSGYDFNPPVVSPGSQSMLSGFCVIPASNVAFIRGASLIGSTGATLAAATTGAGSQTARNFMSFSPAEVSVQGIKPPLLNPGRYHVIGLIRTQATTAACTGVNVFMYKSGATIIEAPTIALAASTNWNTLDLGVFTVTPTAVASIYDHLYVTGYMVGATVGSATGAIDVSGLYLLPEDTTVFVRGVHNDTVTWAETGIHNHSQEGSASAIFTQRNTNVGGVMPRLPVGSGCRVMPFSLANLNDKHHALPPMSLSVQERFTYSR